MTIDDGTKRELLMYCHQYVSERIDRFSNAIASAQADANSETKSSAGDKHETGRAMAQLETENNSKHLAEAHKLKATLGQIDPDKKCTCIELGALVKTDKGNYFISVSAGRKEVHGEHVYMVSVASPIGQHFLGKKVGDGVHINGQNYPIQEIG
jgi:transcription elongation GreA/GreB family factor